MRILEASICLLFVTLVGAGQPTKLTPSEKKLHEAAFSGTLEQVRLLLAGGARVDATDPDRHTPLMWAAFNGHTPVVRLLLDSGARVDTKDKNGRTALLFASSGPFEETVALLLKKGAAVDVQGTLEGFTALMTAAAEGQLRVVRLLLLHGADAALEDSDNDTAESFALQKGHTEVVELLRNPPSLAEKP